MKALVGKWNTKTIVTMAIGAALYGVLMVYGSIPVFSNTQLSTAMVVPVVVGALCGPVPCMITLFLGNVLADLIGGWGMWFDWSIGNGIIGFFVGLLPVYGAKITEGIFTVKHAIIYAVTCFLGTVLALGVITPILTTLFYGGELSITFMQAIFGGISNVAIFVIIGIPVLFALSKRYASRSNLKEEE